MDKTLPKKILYLPVHRYLSDPVFSEIVKEFPGEENIYFYATYDATHQIKFDEAELLKTYRRVVRVPENLAHRNDRGPGFFSRWVPYFSFFTKRGYPYLNFKYIMSVKQLFRELRPDVVVATSDLSYPMRIIKPICDEYKIPVVIVQVAFISGRRTQPGFRHRVLNRLFTKFMKVKLFSDQHLWGGEYDDVNYLVWGPQFKEQIGCARPERVEMVGSIPCDNHLNSKPVETEQLQTKYNLPSGKPLVTICLQELGNYYGAAIQTELDTLFKEIILRRSDLFFIVKPHPRSNYEEIKKRYALAADNYRLVGMEADLQELTALSRAQISMNSVSSFYSVVQGVPIILVDLPTVVPVLDFFEGKIELKARDLNELDAALSAVVAPDYKTNFERQRESYLAEKLYRLDGRTAGRIAQFIRKLLG